LQDVERCARGELSVEECVAVADQLADAANHHLRRSHELAAIATKMREKYGYGAHLPR
jgi:hypothetical protein